MNLKLFLVDVDGTLLDTQKLKEANRNIFAEKFGQASALILWDLYAQVVKEKGFADIGKIALEATSRLKISDPVLIQNVFFNSSFRDFLFPEALEFLRGLKSKGKVLIYSQGDGFYQPLKIKKSGIEEVVGAENVIIREDKTKYLPQLKLDLQKEKFDEIVIIDNLPSFLESARRVFPQAKLVLVQEGKYNT